MSNFFSNIANAAKKTVLNGVKKSITGGSSKPSGGFDSSDWGGLVASAVQAGMSKLPGNSTTVGSALLTMAPALAAIPGYGWIASIGASTLGKGIDLGWGVDHTEARQQLNTLDNLSYGGGKDNIMALASYNPSFNLSKSNYGLFRGDAYDADMRKLEASAFNAERRLTHAIDTDSREGVLNASRELLPYGGALYGGLPMYDVATPIGYSFATQQMEDVNLRYNNKFAPQILALGGGFSTHGSDFEKGLTYINSGGLHETNPLEGVPVGSDGQGGLNLVEEGETIYRSKQLGEGGYVFSDRLVVPTFDAKLYDGLDVLPYDAKIMKKYGGKTFAKASKLIEKDAYGKRGEDSNSAGNVNDPLSDDMYFKTLEVLKGIQEQVREQQRLEEMQKMIAQMSPEQAALFMLAIAMQEQAAEQQALQEQMLMQGMLGMQEMPLPEQENMAEEVPLYVDPSQLLISDGRYALSAYGGYMIPKDDIGLTKTLALGGTLYKGGGNLSIEDALAFIDTYSRVPVIQNALNTKVNDREAFSSEKAYKAALNEIVKNIKDAEAKVKRYYKQHNLEIKDVDLNILLQDIDQYLQTGSFDNLLVTQYSKNLKGRKAQTRTSEFNNLPLIKYADTISKLNAVTLNDKGEYVLLNNPTPYALNDLLKLTDGVFMNGDLVVIPEEAGDSTFYRVPKTGAELQLEKEKLFLNQDELKSYYQQRIADYYNNHNFKGAANETDPVKKYARAHLDRTLLDDFINNLAKSENPKDKQLADIIRANVDLNNTDGLKQGQVWESKSYLDAVDKNPEFFNNNGKSKDHWIGIQHYPLLQAWENIEPDNSSEYRVLAGLDGDNNIISNKILKDYNWEDNPLNIDYSHPSQIAGTDNLKINVYGVPSPSVTNNLIKIGDLWYSIPEGELDNFSAVEKPDSTLSVVAPEGTNHTEKYFDFKDAAGNTQDGQDGYKYSPFPKLPVWPYIAQAGIGLATGIGSVLLNRERPIDHIPNPIENAKNFHRVEIPYHPIDVHLLANDALAQGNAGIRQAINLSAGNSGVARAAAIAGLNNLINNLGKINFTSADTNEQRRVNVGKINQALNQEYDKMDLQQRMARNEALLKYYGLEANNVNEQRRLNEARRQAMLTGIGSGLTTIGAGLKNYADTEFEREFYDWMGRTGAYGSMNRYFADRKGNR